MRKAIFFFLLIGTVPTIAQRFFTLQTDSLSRSYALVTPPADEPGRPLVILLHDTHVLPITLARLDWTKLAQPPVMVFPAGLQNRWSCSHRDSSRMDEAFLMKLIFQVQANFKTDPSRVFIIGMGNAFCSAERFSQMHPALVRAALRWHLSGKVILPKMIFPEPARQFDSLVVHHPSIKKTIVRESWNLSPPEEKLYARHATLSFHVGRWQQASASRTELDTLTWTDLSNYHFLFGYQLAWQWRERWVAFLENEFLIIPKEKKINSISWGGGQGVRVNASGKGGIVIPYGLGVKYFIPSNQVRYFFSASTGATFLLVAGGTANGGTGGLTKVINKRRANVWRSTVGAGLDFHVSEGTSLQFTGQYTYSARLEPAIASVTRYQGLSFLFGLLFIMGKSR